MTDDEKKLREDIRELSTEIFELVKKKECYSVRAEVGSFIVLLCNYIVVQKDPLAALYDAIYDINRLVQEQISDKNE